MPAFSLVPSPPVFPDRLQPMTQRSSTTSSKLLIRSFGMMLSPVTLSAHNDSTSELLRTL